MFTLFNLTNSGCRQRVVSISAAYSRDQSFEACYLNCLIVLFLSCSNRVLL